MKVLIADANDAARAQVATYARDTLRWECVEAGNGREVCELLRQTEFDVVVLDLVLPTLDGFTVMEWIGQLTRDAKKHPRIIVHSALADAPSRRRAFEYGCHEFVAKGADDLLGALRAHSLRTATEPDAAERATKRQARTRKMVDP